MASTWSRLAATILFVFLVSPSVAQPSRSCTVSALEGEAQYGINGDWRPLKIVTKLPPQARIKTGPENRVEISCGDGIRVTVGVATEVNIGDLVSPSRSIFFRLVAGIIGIVAPGAGWDRIEVRTPVAIASTRSTEWLVENDAERGAAVFVRDGEVSVALLNGTRVELAAGEGISVGQDGEAGPVKTWGAARIAQSVDALGLGWQ